jgi:hypothetical protein
VSKPSSRKLIFKVCAAALCTLLGACAPEETEFISDGPGASDAGKYLYVSSGSCYGGGATVPATGSATITKFRLSDLTPVSVIMDYSTFAGDQPVSIEDYDEDNILVVVENASGRRVDLVRKDGSGPATYIPPSVGLSAVLRSIKKLSNGAVLISKSTAIEKYSPPPARSRVLNGANPFINAPAGACATTATLITSMWELSNGKVLYTHAAATPNNKIVLISSTGYAAAGDCLAAQAAPVTTSLPTAMIEHSSGKLLVAFGSATATSNLIQSMSVNATTNTFSGSALSYMDTSLLNGPSAMTEDPASTDVFIANGATAMGNINRYSVNATSGVLTPVQIGASSIYTKCVTSMKVIDE